MFFFLNEPNIQFVIPHFCNTCTLITSKKIFKSIKRHNIFQHHVIYIASCSVSPGGGDSKTGEVRVQRVKGKNALFLVHSCIVNEYRLLCNTHDASEQRRATAALFLLYSVFRFLFFFFVCHSDLSIFFLCASIVCFNNLKRKADLVL